MSVTIRWIARKTPAWLVAMLLINALSGFTNAAEAPHDHQVPEAHHDHAIEEITVVGTAIKGTPIDAPYAVQSIDRDRLEATGSPTLSDFFKGLGASQGVLGERSSAFNSDQLKTVDASVANVNLRGLGASRTLVLINGRRQVYQRRAAQLHRQPIRCTGDARPSGARLDLPRGARQLPHRGGQNTGHNGAAHRLFPELGHHSTVGHAL